MYESVQFSPSGSLLMSSAPRCVSATSGAMKFSAPFSTWNVKLSGALPECTIKTQLIKNEYYSMIKDTSTLSSRKRRVAVSRFSCTRTRLASEQTKQAGFGWSTRLLTRIAPFEAVGFSAMWICIECLHVSLYYVTYLCSFYTLRNISPNN